MHSANHGNHEFFFFKIRRFFYETAKNGDCRANFKYVSSRIEFMDNWKQDGIACVHERERGGVKLHALHRRHV